MIIYHLWANLKPGIRDIDFVKSTRAYLYQLKKQWLVESYRIARLVRRKSGLGNPKFFEFLVTIEFLSLEQLDQAFEKFASRSNPTDSIYFVLDSMFSTVKFSLYQDVQYKLQEAIDIQNYRAIKTYLPYLRCPVCGLLSRSNLVGDLEEWFSHFPQLSKGEVVPVKCFDCFSEIKMGDQVVERESTSNLEIPSENEAGEVVDLLNSNNETLFIVQFVGRVKVLARAKIRKVFGTP